jgi:polysaccharide pyruvyl transferase WcaK-like protein
VTPARGFRRYRPAITGPRVGLVGFFGEGNLGNDASLDAMLTYLRDEHPDAIIDVLCGRPDRVAERSGVPTARWRWFQTERHSGTGLATRATKAFGTTLGICVDAYHICAWVRRHDVVIVPGMGVLEATLPLRPWLTPYLMFLTCASGRVFGTRVALVSVGANVINQRLSKWLVVAAARHAHYRSFRDAGSKDAMRRMGLRTSDDSVYPDLAFSLPIPHAEPPTVRSVGVGIMDYSGNNDDRPYSQAVRARYTAAMTRFVLWLADNDRPVLLLAGDTRDERVITSVLADVRAQRPALERKAVTAVVPASSLNELMQQLATVETVVATRFHTVLSALKLGKPTLAVGYAAKFDALMTQIGFAEFSLQARSIDAEVLIDRFNEMETRSPDFAERTGKRNAANEWLLKKQFAELSTLFDRAPLTPSPHGPRIPRVRADSSVANSRRHPPATLLAGDNDG